jgi:glucose-1-phosphate cytidylyltransferase
MKVLILAGGFGTRLAEETARIPKPLVDIGGKPMLWHIMKIYAHYGFSDFLIACGYKSELIKEYFHNFAIRNNDYEINLATGVARQLNESSPPWVVAAVDTGLETMTGGRIGRLRKLIGGKRFMVTYGDGVGDVDIAKLVAFHEAHGKLATVTAVRPPARFGALEMEGDRVRRFSEKPQTDAGWINGGFFVFEPEVLDLMTDDATILERKPLETLASRSELVAFKHEGFWQPMDTLREKQLLEQLWESGKAPWKVWP